MKFLPSLLAATALSAAALTPAFASQELAQKKALHGCHGIDNKIVGPAYKDVAKKYKGGVEAKGGKSPEGRQGCMG